MTGRCRISKPNIDEFFIALLYKTYAIFHFKAYYSFLKEFIDSQKVIPKPIDNNTDNKSLLMDLKVESVNKVAIPDMDVVLN